jgi:oligopeptide transport system ATP-binding protein
LGSALLTVRDLHTVFETENGVVKAVDGVSFDVAHQETLGIVGESGCGKSVTSLSIMRLLPTRQGRVVGGDILFDGKDMLAASDDEMRRMRGKDIAMIFQEPMTSLNPVFTVGSQIAEAIRLHRGLGAQEALDEAREILEKVGIPTPGKTLHRFPHELSGGMRQRVMIGMALSCNPRLLIADEPTTALDVTIQAQILELMRRLKEEYGMSMMLITHNLGVVAEMAERIIVMYCGAVIEESPVEALFEDPLHPYTKGLLASMPRLDETRTRMEVISGTVPNPLEMPFGCRFHPRCPCVEDRCKEEAPPLFDLGDGRKAKCWRYKHQDSAHLPREEAVV